MVINHLPMQCIHLGLVAEVGIGITDTVEERAGKRNWRQNMSEKIERSEHEIDLLFLIESLVKLLW